MNCLLINCSFLSDFDLIDIPNSGDIVVNQNIQSSEVGFLDPLMAPDVKVRQAFAATRALGIPDEEVKPILKQLLRVYNKKWELIEEGNFRTLIDTYYESKENKVTTLLLPSNITFVLTLLAQNSPICTHEVS